MYRLMFLLVFLRFLKAEFAEPIEVMMDIYFQTDEETRLSEVKCETKEKVYVVKAGQEIYVYIKTITYLRDFWCKNAVGTTIYNSALNLRTQVPLQYTLNSIESSKTNTDGTWTCTFEIKKSKYIKTKTQTTWHKNKEYILSSCDLQFQVTEPPTVSLNIEQLSEYFWINKIQGNKKSTFKFTYEEEIKFDCSLTNPTDDNVKYKMRYYLDGVCKKSTTVSLAPREYATLSYNFKIGKDNKLIKCSAVDQGSKKGALNPIIEIHLQYVPDEEDVGGRLRFHPAPSVFPVIRKPKLTKGQYLPGNFTQIHYYEFADGEDADFECTLEGHGEPKDYYFAMYEYQESPHITKYKTGGSITRTFKLHNNEIIYCVAWDPDDKNNTYSTIVYLKYKQESNRVQTELPELTIGGVTNLEKEELSSSMQYYNYQFIAGDVIKIKCNAKGREKTYDLAFLFDGRQVKSCPDVNTIEHSFILEKDNKEIRCVARDKAANPLVTHVIRLHSIQPVSAKINLSVTGLPENSCVAKDKHKLEQTCNYTYKDAALIGTNITLYCNLAGQLQSTYTLSFGNNAKQVQNGDKQRTISNPIELTGKNETVMCKAMRESGNLFSVSVNIYYVPPSPTTTESSSYNVPNPMWWLKFLGGGVAVIVILCVVCCFVCCRRKKSHPDDSTYVNMTKDQTSYETLPVAAKMTLKQGTEPKVTIEGPYSEPKDSQDISEALYSDPNHFNASDTYAQPCDNSVEAPKTTDYAEPYLPTDEHYAKLVKPKGNYARIGNIEGNYASIGNSEANYASIGNSEANYASIGNSDGNYAEIGRDNNKELYAEPIPKSKRPVKVDESNYSNVFTEQYANTKK